jgi:Nucleotidyl transferase AbiEii toxin, Type IV TA system
MLCVLLGANPMQIFKRPHHQRIAQVLSALDADILREHHCWFAGGTVIAMRYGEYRESVDMDFLVSDVTRYRALRVLLKGSDIQNILRNGSRSFIQSGEIRADQYGIRTVLMSADIKIKFEIVLEGRIHLSTPGKRDLLCGVSTLTPLDMATSKLLANSDRWNDESVFARDVIDLAMIRPSLALLMQALAKSEAAYGASIKQDLEKVLNKLQHQEGLLERCMQVMAMTMSKAEVWQRLRALRRVL